MSDPAELRFGHPVGPWHQWFAWYPVWTWNQGWTWLCHVYRRRIQKHDYLTAGEPCAQWWQYAHPETHTPAQAAGSGAEPSRKGTKAA